MTHAYDDIIGLPHHRSATRKAMSMMDRAAQFAPFAALTGYEDGVETAGKETSARMVEADLGEAAWQTEIIKNTVEPEWAGTDAQADCADDTNLI